MNIEEVFAKPPQFLYRYFDQEEHAQQLVDGRVWISTLEHCRHTDELRQHDPEEATLTGKIGNLVIQPRFDSGRTRADLAAMGIFVRDHESSITVRETTVVQKIPDGYILCFSTSPTLTFFGRYCVKVTEPAAFFGAVSDALALQGNIAGEGLFGPMHYTSRTTTDRINEDHPAFVGDPSMAREREARMFWITRPDSQAVRQEIEVPAVTEMCSRIR